QQDAWGAVEVDNLVLKRQAEAWQYRVSLSTSDPSRTPRLRSVTVAVADRGRAPSGPAVTLPAGWARDLAVPVESQLMQDAAVAWDICSPTSLTMVLRFWGVQTSPPQVYRGVRDGTTGIYGNWPLNTAYAGSLNFDAYVARLYSLDQVRAEIAAGRPTIISIKYGNGELPGAPLNSTSGHIVVVRGFTDKGEVIVNDPAVPDLASVRRVLKAADLEKVWLRSGGIAYLVTPRP
ncbi:MAG: peptidase C39 family protein, partial [Chloroflexota bacterium]